MDEALLICRIVLAGVFAVAGLTKLADLSRTREGFADLGVPRAVVPAAVILVPLAELAVAVALVPAASAWWGALGALILLAAFSAVIGRVLARGEQADCNCFGSLQSSPVDSRLLVRNGGLAALAGFVLVGGWNGAGATRT